MMKGKGNFSGTLTVNIGSGICHCPRSFSRLWLCVPPSPKTSVLSLIVYLQRALKGYAKFPLFFLGGLQIPFWDRYMGPNDSFFRFFDVKR